MRKILILTNTFCVRLDRLWERDRKAGFLQTRIFKVQNIKNPISVKAIKLRPDSDAAPLACSRLSDSGEDAKVKGT